MVIGTFQHTAEHEVRKQLKPIPCLTNVVCVFSPPHTRSLDHLVKQDFIFSDLKKKPGKFQ